MAPTQLPSTSAQSSSSEIRYDHNGEHSTFCIPPAIVKQAPRHHHKKAMRPRSVIVRVVHVTSPTLIHANLASFKDIVQRFTGVEQDERTSIQQAAPRKAKSKMKNARKAANSAQLDSTSSVVSVFSNSSSSCASASHLDPWENSIISDADEEEMSTSLLSSTLDVSFLNGLDQIMGHRLNTHHELFPS